MVLDLTYEQVEQLKPLFEAVVNADNLNLTGMLVAQLYLDTNTGTYRMRAGFLPHAQAKLLRWQACEETSSALKSKADWVAHVDDNRLFFAKAVEELQIVEREIGVPSEALKIIGRSRLNSASAGPCARCGTTTEQHPDWCRAYAQKSNHDPEWQCDNYPDCSVCGPERTKANETESHT